MEHKAFWKLAASSLILATTMVGCSSSALHSRAGLASANVEKKGAQSALAAEKALAARDAERAVASAEAAVASDADNAAYRTLLGRAYLLSGRFQSAQTALQDAVTLGNRDPRTIVNLALVKTALGDSGQAHELLVAHMDVLPAADYGLAMAMTGDTTEAIRVLGQAIHDPAAGSRERQNLAYAYALSGRWAEARQIAEMDMAPVAAAQRVIAWASAAKPGDASARVIAMIGVNPVANDSGVPASLALGASTTAAIAYASADVPAEAAPAPVVETATPVAEAPAAVAVAEVAAQAPAQIAPDHIIKPVEIAASSPVIQASRIPARQAVRPVPAAQAINMLRPVNLAQGTAWVVQLGAYDSPAIAQEKWRRMTARNAVLKMFPTVTSQVNVNGRVYHRLAVAGFGNRQTAVSLCGKVRSHGNSCFVRMGGAEAAPAKWAVAAKPRQLAMR